MLFRRLLSYPLAPKLRSLESQRPSQPQDPDYVLHRRLRSISAPDPVLDNAGMLVALTTSRCSPVMASAMVFELALAPEESIHRGLSRSLRRH